VPPIREIAPGHQIACHFPIEVKDLPKRIDVEDVAKDDATPPVPTIEQNLGVGAPHA
jgi:hypothetical protein